MPSFYNRGYLEQHVPQWYRENFGNLTASLLDIPEWRERVFNSNLSFVRFGLTEYDHNILVHSELRSRELEFYQDQGFETVYWWSHAMIALDWYRYAQHDPLLSRPRDPKKLFNIYSRAWHYPREYRLRLLDLVKEHDMQDHCRVRFNTWDQGIHYSQYQYHNPAMRAQHDLNTFTDPAPGPGASASYSARDYHSSLFDVVLETLFDDERLHLTEKTLRPIACGVPFLLCGTHGSLEYLRSYGFQTFGDVIDEGYDNIRDPGQRLAAVAQVMRDMRDSGIMQDPERRRRIDEICQHNRKRFFSPDFSRFVLDEFRANFAQARAGCEKHRQGQNRAQLLELLKRRSITPSQSGSSSR